MYSSRTKRLLSLVKESEKGKENGNCNTITSNLLDQSDWNSSQKAVIVEQLPPVTDFCTIFNDQVEKPISDGYVFKTLVSICYS